MKVKKKSIALNVYGLIMLPTLIISNLANALFTVWLTVEQLGSSWGEGTGMELAVLYPWLIELLCAPVVIAGGVYLLLHVWRTSSKWLRVTNIVLYFALILQYALTNLFIWF
jgi:hypothetical protein